jgi:hypothetical protein
MREVEAYTYNVTNFSRFGNTPNEQKVLKGRLDYNKKLYKRWKGREKSKAH